MFRTEIRISLVLFVIVRLATESENNKCNLSFKVVISPEFAVHEPAHKLNNLAGLSGNGHCFPTWKESGTCPVFRIEFPREHAIKQYSTVHV